MAVIWWWHGRPEGTRMVTYYGGKAWIDIADIGGVEYVVVPFRSGGSDLYYVTRRVLDPGTDDGYVRFVKGRCYGMVAGVFYGSGHTCGDGSAYVFAQGGAY